MALPAVVTTAACLTLAFAPPIVGFGAAAGAAFVWVWWLERYPEPVPGSTGVVDVRDELSVRPCRAPSRVFVYLTPDQAAHIEIRTAAQTAHRIGGSLVAGYVVTESGASKGADHGTAHDTRILATNVSLAEAVGATVLNVRASDVLEGVVALADREGITHAVFGYSGELGGLLAPDSIVGGVVRRCRGVQVQVVTRPPTA